MIALRGVHKSYWMPEGRRVILAGASVTIPDGTSLGVLGSNGAGKSTLVRLLSGVEAPDAGRILRSGRVSFPLGFSGTFHPELTGRENLCFLARLYGAEEAEVVAYAERFAEIGAYMRMPVGTYSSGMRARLAFAACLAIRFDTYLIDEVTAVGDAAFRARCLAAFEARMEESDVVMVSHDLDQLRAWCGAGAVLAGGRLLVFDELEAAIEAHARMLRDGAGRGMAA